MSPEPHITINGVALSTGQSRSVRVAISSFLAYLDEPGNEEALGPIAAVYRKDLAAVICAIAKDER